MRTRPLPPTSRSGNMIFELRRVLIPLFCDLTGYTDVAVRRKIEDGVWLQGKHYRKAPDGRIHINMQEFYVWGEQAG